MAETVAQIVADVQLAYKDAQTHIVLDCINRAHRDICAEFPVYKATITVNLTSGTREYAIDRDVMTVRSAIYYPSAVDRPRVLTGVNVADLDNAESDWRIRVAGTPRTFYLDGGDLGLHPTPDTTTVGGYPYVSLIATEATDLAISDSLPTSIRSRSAHVARACMYFAQKEDKDSMPIYEQVYEACLNEMERTMGRRNSRYHRTMSPDGWGNMQV